MILRTETVEQTIDGEQRGTFLKQVVMTPGTHPLGMVRKRLPPPAPTRGAVLLIHGFGQNRYTWHVPRRSFANYLASHAWDVFNVDLRGHGRSGRFGAPRPRIFDEYICEDVPACIEEAVRLSGHSRVFLLGHSMGGLISYSVAATHRDRVRGTMSLGSPYRFGLGSRTLAAVSALASAVRFTGALDADAGLPVRLIGRHLKVAAPIWDSRVLPLPIRAWFPGSVEKEVLDDYLGLAFDRASLAVALSLMGAGPRAALRSHDGSIDYGMAFEHMDKPLLVVAGTHDSLAPVESVRPAFDRSRSRDKTWRVFPLGHIDLVVGREAPRTVWPLCSGWMAKR